MHTVVANQSIQWFQSKVEFCFQSKMLLAVASICLAVHAARVGHSKDVNSLAKESKVTVTKTLERVYVKKI